VALGFDAVVKAELRVFGGGAVLDSAVTAGVATPNIEAVVSGGEEIRLFGAGQIVGHRNASDRHTEAHCQRQPIPLHTPTPS